jgi:esterase/lipase
VASDLIRHDEYQITGNYDLCVRAFRTTRRLLKLNIKLHDDDELPCRKAIEHGDIFLFNHFARFETFIPQYLIHAETGAYCRSIASAEFFDDERFGSFLRTVGVVPNDMPDLFAFIASEILHGRKLVIFPEGGMVKDKQVIDAAGEFGIFSRTAMARRKHHRGAAVIALAVDAFKTALLSDFSRGHYQQVERWAEQLGFENTESLMVKALKPTTIVPSHITFYPIRVNDNILYSAAKLFNKGINKRFAEELIIEGNLLFRHTDMDIRFARPLVMARYWKWWEKLLLPNVVHRFESMQELFNLTPASGHWGGRIHAIGMQAKSNQVRDDYMQAMYKAVTINLSHIASYLFLHFYLQGDRSVSKVHFHKALYLCIKAIQNMPVHLHRSLKNPEEYGMLMDGGSSRLQQFLDTVGKMDLIKITDDRYILQHKLINEFHFDEVRTENLISVYANEIAPLREVTELLDKTCDTIDQVSARQLADLRYDDQLRAHEWDHQQYSKPRHDEINQQQTATQDADWFFLKSKTDNAPAVLLIHGFMATPAEVLPLGEQFHQLGFHALGVRLKGHGTSPWDLRDRDWQDWAASVRRGFEILAAYSDHIHVIGFSTGGLLALNQAVQHPHPKLASVISISAPVGFQNKQMKFVPLLHHANKLVRWVSSEGLIPFRPNDAENPDINYAHIPIRALYQLQKMIEYFFDHPAVIHCPVTIMQADGDPVVALDSAEKLLQHIEAQDKQIIMVHANSHGILYADTDNTQQRVIDSVLNLNLQPENQPHAETERA